MILARTLLAILLVSITIPAMADSQKAPQVAPVASEWPWRLTGTLISPDQRIALFANRDGRTQSVSEGQQIDGWTVVVIRPDSAILTADTGTRTILIGGFPPTDTGAAKVFPNQQEAVAVRDIGVNKDVAVRDNLAKQESDHKTAFDALAKATKQMESQKTQR
jgi:hypothetical protein